MAKAKGEFEVASWNEDTYEEREGGGKLTLRVGGPEVHR